MSDNKFEEQECDTTQDVNTMKCYPDFLRQALKDLNYKFPSNIQLQIYEKCIAQHLRTNIIA